MIGCGMFSSTILESAFGEGFSCLHRVRVYGRPFSIDPSVKMKYRLFRSIQTKAPNAGFILSTGLFKNPLISTRLWNYMLDRHAIGNFRVDILTTPMKRSSCFQSSSAAGTAYSYWSCQNQERTCTLIERQ